MISCILCTIKITETKINIYYDWNEKNETTVHWIQAWSMLD
mgnify:CR=1 FL=1